MFCYNTSNNLFKWRHKDQAALRIMVYLHTVSVLMHLGPGFPLEIFFVKVFVLHKESLVACRAAFASTIRATHLRRGQAEFCWNGNARKKRKIFQSAMLMWSK